MEGLVAWFLIMIIVWVGTYVARFFDNLIDNKASERAQGRIIAMKREMNAQRKLLDVAFEEKECIYREQVDLLNKNKEAFDILVSQKTQGFPWLAEAFAEHVALLDEKRAVYLETKPHPALKGAEEVRQIKAEKRALNRTNKILEYIIKYYEYLFPWLIDYKDEAIDDLFINSVDISKEEGDQYDYARDWLSKEEYEKLPSVIKYQRALEHYRDRPKSKWEIGRDYERYIGYLWEQKGFTVYYQGILHGCNDHGRDLICVSKEQVVIIQCKCWSKNKTIHENHINQLFGTTVEYWLGVNEGKPKSLFWDDYESGKIRSKIVTSTSLSDTALDFARALNIEVKGNFPLREYPMVKCNISLRDGSKIYHLPFDQQYDKTQINKPGECYTLTVQEAESMEFRRAFRWHPENS